MAPLGYGNGDEVTTVNYGPDRANKFITTYFRHAFDLVFWPTTLEEYRLESAARLEPDSWTPITNSIQVLNNTNTFFELLIQSPRFYRLRRP